MTNCPHCGRDTNAERPAPTGTLAAGDQAYRARRQGVTILPGADTSDNAAIGNQPHHAA
jgi:hypothetical protein